MYKIPTLRLLFFMSIIDLLLLTICATDPILIFLFNYQIRLNSSSTCKMHVFLTYFLSHLSSIVLMVVCIERSLLIHNIKLKIFKIDSISSTLSIIAILVGFINSHFLVLFKSNINSLTNNNYENELFDDGNYSINISIYINEYSNYSFESTINPVVSCYPNDMPHYTYFLNNIWTWIDTSIYSIIPFVIMIICSILILIQTKKTNRNFKIRNKRIVLQNKRRNNQIALMLLTTNFFFILFSLLYDITNNNLMKSNSTLILTAHLLAYSNNSFNFVFYTLFSSKYRSVLFGMLKIPFLFGDSRPINQAKIAKPNVKQSLKNNIKSKDDHHYSNYDSIIHKFEYIDEYRSNI
jgi:hypothetical protein